MRKVIFVLLTSLLFIACSNDDFDNSSKGESPVEVRNLEFIYQGVLYSSLVSIDKDSLLFFEDEDVKDIYNKLNELPSLAILVSSDRPDEFFDDYESLQAVLSKQSGEKNSELKTRANSFMYCDLKLYDQANYSGRMVSFSLYSPSSNVYGQMEAPNLNYLPGTVNQPISFDNVLSSITITVNDPNYNSLSVTFFDDIYFKGKSKTYSNFNTLREADFSKYIHTEPSMWNHTRRWNQVISSIKLTWN